MNKMEKKKCIFDGKEIEPELSSKGKKEFQKIKDSLKCSEVDTKRKQEEDDLWHDEEFVMRAAAIGEMAQILIKAMDWETKFKKYKMDMYKDIMQK